MAKPRKPFSIWRFSITRGLQFAGLLVLLRFIFPEIWSSEITAGAGRIVLCMFAMSIINCFFEWFFHRYVLHGWIFWIFERFSRGHEHHHAITIITLSQAKPGFGRRVINRYPITGPEQYEDSTFPSYALPAFWVIFSPIIISLKLLFPDWPILLSGYFAVTVSMFLYEILHSLEHRPFEWWEQAVGGKTLWRDKSRSQRFWTRLYGFHHGHHGNIRVNESVGGFVGLPVADWLFGTYFQPKELWLHDNIATAKEFTDVPKGRGFVQALDNWAKLRRSKMIGLKRTWAVESQRYAGHQKFGLYLYYAVFERARDIALRPQKKEKK